MTTETPRIMTPKGMERAIKRAQCSATSRQTGERCKAPAILGGTVCRHHGGNAPQVKAAGEQRHREMLLALVSPAIKRLGKAIESESQFDGSNAIRAAQIVLDRSGFGPSSQLEVSEGPNRTALLLAARKADAK